MHQSPPIRCGECPLAHEPKTYKRESGSQVEGQRTATAPRRAASVAMPSAIRRQRPVPVPGEGCACYPISIDLKQVDLENQSGIGRDVAFSGWAVGHTGRNDQLALAANFHP